MDEKYIEQLYGQLGGEAKFGAYNDFKDLISNNPEYRKQFHANFGENTLGTYQDFEGLVKKKVSPLSPGVAGPESPEVALAPSFDQLLQESTQPQTGSVL